MRGASGVTSSRDGFELGPVLDAADPHLRIDLRPARYQRQLGKASPTGFEACCRAVGNTIGSTKTAVQSAS